MRANRPDPHQFRGCALRDDRIRSWTVRARPPTGSVMIRREHGETNDITDTANTMLALHDGSGPSQIKQSVLDLQRNLAAKNEELHAQRELLELRIKERDEASDAYGATVREEEEIAQRARDEYARLKKEERYQSGAPRPTCGV